MKMRSVHSFTPVPLATAVLLWFGAPQAKAADAKTTHSTAEHVIANKEADPEKQTSVKVLRGAVEDAKPAKDRAWLGVGVEEASEALADQLGLDAGVGLVVTYVSDDSPAAKAGLKKNDVLIELEGQSLVHPAQLRKLVQVRKPGNKVKLVFYRGGKKHTESATLEQAPARFGLLDDFDDEKVRQLHRELIELPHKEALQAHSKVLRESLGDLPRVTRLEIDSEIRRNMEAARKALAEAAREGDHNKDSLRVESERLKELLKSGISVDENATVLVRSKGKGKSRSIVKTDDSGTIVVLGPPNLHLTAHDKSGKLIFDGAIATSEQRGTVPAEVWKRVEPLLEEESDADSETKESEP